MTHIWCVWVLCHLCLFHLYLFHFTVLCFVYERCAHSSVSVTCLLYLHPTMRLTLLFLFLLLACVVAGFPSEQLNQHLKKKHVLPMHISEDEGHFARRRPMNKPHPKHTRKGFVGFFENLDRLIESKDFVLVVFSSQFSISILGNLPLLMVLFVASQFQSWWYSSSVDSSLCPFVCLGNPMIVMKNAYLNTWNGEKIVNIATTFAVCVPARSNRAWAQVLPIRGLALPLALAGLIWSRTPPPSRVRRHLILPPSRGRVAAQLQSSKETCKLPGNFVPNA